jgi:hypothetical protein
VMRQFRQECGQSVNGLRDSCGGLTATACGSWPELSSWGAVVPSKILDVLAGLSQPCE